MLLSRAPLKTTKGTITMKGKNEGNKITMQAPIRR